MPAAESVISSRAKAIAQGLIRTGRAVSTEQAGGFIRLQCKAGGFYWISGNGRRLMRGTGFRGADELQKRFADTMERAGAGTGAGQNRPLTISH